MMKGPAQKMLDFLDLAISVGSVGHLFSIDAQEMRSNDLPMATVYKIRA